MSVCLTVTTTVLSNWLNAFTLFLEEWLLSSYPTLYFKET